MQGLLNPDDTLQRQRDKLMDICAALMRRVEQAPSERSNAYAQFERAALLEAQVRQRTADLERALDLLNESNAQLAQANREIDTARSNLNEAIESVDEGFALFDAQENLVLYNSRFCQVLGDVAPHLTPGLPFAEFVEIVSQSACLDLPDGTKPEHWARRRMARHRDDRVVFNIALTEDRWMQVSEHRTKEGGTVILQTDVTDIMREQHRQRAQLVDDQARMLRATLDHLAQGVCIFDKDACLVGWNRKLERMIQLPVPGPRVGMAFVRILDLLRGQMTFAAGKGRAWLETWSLNTEGRAPITFELNDDGEQIFNVFAQEMPDEGFVISFTDVTNERRSAEALRELNRTLEQRVAERTEELGAALDTAKRANETKTRFVAAASHDLLQPLSAAKLYLASLQDLELDGAARGISEKAESALTSVEGIIEALLDISKLDAGNTVFDIQPFALGPVLTSLSSEMAPAAAAKGLRLSIIPSSVSVVSDPVFFRRILQNLITNAIRYTDHGRIVVGVRRRRDGTVRIEVHDTGRGIKEEDHERIFQEFARLEPSHSGANGLGLGLAIVERACASLGHQLDLASTFGTGSCFSVTADVHRGRAPPDEAHTQESGAFDVLAGKMLLLVENDEPLAHAMALKFEGWGAHVIHAQSAETALDLLAEIDLVPDLMLLDFQLSAGLNGLDLCRVLRGRYGVVPTLMISANRSPELRLGCELLGVPLLTKPLDPAALREALDTACA